MHCAWLIDDIWRLISEHLTPRSLACLAQTCKTLSNLAIAILWHRLTSFSPLLFCLPPEYQHIVLEPKHVARLDLYASKVRILVLEETNIKKPIRLPAHFDANGRKQKKNKSIVGKSWQELWEEIAALRSQSEFLPNLQRVRISNAAADYLIPLSRISGLNLEYIYIKYLHGKQSESLMKSFLGQLQDVSRLEFLFARDGGNILPKNVLKHAPVKHLRLDPRLSYGGMFDSSCFKTFRLPPEIFEKDALEHLTLPLSRDWCPPNLLTPMRKRFPALKTLWLHLTTFRPEVCKDCTNISADSWTCRRGPHTVPALNGASSGCGRRSPTFFFDALDSPSLTLLNISFHVETTGPMLLDVISAAQRNIDLSSLTGLSLAGRSWIPHCMECGQHPGSKISPAELRQALRMLLPLPKLRVLRLTVAPNFLDELNMGLYKEIASGLPELDTLTLGHGSFASLTLFFGNTYRERVPLHHVAAFCSLLPCLTEVSVGCVDGTLLGEQVQLDWVCMSVTRLRISMWAKDANGGGVSRDAVNSRLRAYFPCSDLAAHGLGDYF